MNELDENNFYIANITINDLSNDSFEKKEKHIINTNGYQVSKDLKFCFKSEKCEIKEEDYWKNTFKCYLYPNKKEMTESHWGCLQLEMIRRKEKYNNE